MLPAVASIVAREPGYVPLPCDPEPGLPHPCLCTGPGGCIPMPRDVTPDVTPVEA